MPKRKRGELDGTGGHHEDVPTGARQQRVQHKILQGAKKLGHAFKVAKGFERQKLGRRRKTAVEQKNERDVQRIDQEIAMLKALDNSKSALQHLHKALLRNKAVADAEALPDSVSAPVSTPSDTASLNVNARLCNSNPVKQALPAVLSAVQQALGLHVERVEAPKRKELRSKESENVVAGPKPGTAKPRRATRDDEDGTMDEDDVSVIRPKPASEEDDGEDDDGNDNDEVFARFDDRLADSNSSNDDADIDAEDLERKLATEGIPLKRDRPDDNTSRAYNHARDLSLSSSSSPSRSTSPEPVKARATNKSTFIPSLTMGGYISGSGSDLDSDFDSDIDTAPRKNRRGQRARQQIYEKKYGTRAKHLQDLNRSTGRESRWDMKRGAIEGPRRPGGAERSRGGGRPRATAGNDTSVGERQHKKHRDDAGALHPSWAAKKLAKEKGNVPVQFSGKKIKFD